MIILIIALLDLDDLLAFIMVNRTLYTIGIKYFQAVLCEYGVPSAGHRLVCLGDHCSDDDLPPGFLPEDLAKASAWRESGDLQDCTFHQYALKEFRDAGVFSYRSMTWFQGWCEDFPSGESSWPPSRNEHRALNDILERRYPSDLDWVLCNLTKRVYVTTDAISEFTGERPYGPFFYQRIGFGEVLLCQICWSSDPESHLAYDGPIHRGKWAANRFLITTMDQLEVLEPVTGGEDGEWEDVSDVVVGEMATIFRSDFGDFWKECFARPKKPFGRNREVYDPYDFEYAGHIL